MKLSHLALSQGFAKPAHARDDSMLVQDFPVFRRGVLNPSI